MALITCPECGGKVSDNAATCIHCGYPLAKMNSEGKLVIVVGDCGGAGTKISIVTDGGREIAKLDEGQSTTLSVNKDMHIYAKRMLYKQSDSVLVKAHKTTKVSVTAFASGFSWKLNMMELD